MCALAATSAIQWCSREGSLTRSVADLRHASDTRNRGPGILGDNH
jgi:hypothetical protein